VKTACLDSSAWIEIAHNGANAAAFLESLANPSAVVVSTISLFEVWKYSALHGDETRAQQIAEFMQQGIVVAPDPDIAIQAARLSIRYKFWLQVAPAGLGRPVGATRIGDETQKR